MLSKAIHYAPFWYVVYHVVLIALNRTVLAEHKLKSTIYIYQTKVIHRVSKRSSETQLGRRGGYYGNETLSQKDLHRLDTIYISEYISYISEHIIKQCQFYTNVLPMYQYYAIRKISFLSNLPMTQNQVLQTLHDSFVK